MRRADRLFQIVQFLRGRRLTTAAFLAGRLGVSLRTVYRDVRDLSLSGVPVEGEAGVGYRVRAGFDVPPLMFTLDEVEGLAVGGRMGGGWGGAGAGGCSPTRRAPRSRRSSRRCLQTAASPWRRRGSTRRPFTSTARPCGSRNRGARRWAPRAA